MKTTILVTLASLFCLNLTAQTFVDKKGKIHLWGISSLEQIKSETYKEWYSKNYDEHVSVLNENDATLLKDTKVKIFLGTWCGDTKYLLPRFIKSWEQMGLPINQLEFIALHNEAELYKQGPNKETAGLNIHRVPTFIFEKGGKEIGRIVERTVHDLDTDIKCIANGYPYECRYQGVELVNDILENNPTDSLESESFKKTVSKKVRRETSSPSELNTYAWVLFTEKKTKEAEFVFSLNAGLFEHNPYIRESYGRCLMKNQKWKEAKVEYQESLRLMPENKIGVKRLNEIYEALEKEGRTIK